MPSPRPTDGFGPLRSRLLAAVAFLRARPLPVFAVLATLALVLLLPFHFVNREEQFIGVPAAVVSLVVVAGALVGGPRVGVALAVVAGAAYDSLIVTERWLASSLTTAAVLVVWVLAGFVTGMLGDRYRSQVARALDEAHRPRDALDRVVEATPSFHARGSTAAVARAICDAARATFGCDLAALFAIEGERLRLLARSPFLANTGDRLVMEPSPELQRELAEYLLPRFIADVRAPDSPRVPRAITSDPDQVSAVRAPVLLDGQPVALLAMSWARPVPEPGRGELGVVQRFVEHAAVALAQAQRAEAQREVAALYRRFQTSLVPEVAVDVPGVAVATLYRPGERRMLLGGDFVDALARPGGRVAAVIGDVTGHGPDAAALGASLRAAWRALALRDTGLVETLRTLNRLTLDEGARVERGDPGFAMLATVCALEIDVPDRRALVALAGHPAPLVLGAGVTPVRLAPGPMLGLADDGEWAPRELLLPRDWGLFLYTDGIIEARLAPGEPARLGVAGLAAHVAGLWARRATSAADLAALVDALQEAQGGPLADDVTLLLVTSGRGGG